MRAVSPTPSVPGARSAAVRRRGTARGRVPALLARAALVLPGSLDVDETVRSLASLVVPDLADACVVRLGGDESRPPHVEVAAGDETRTRTLRRWLRDQPATGGTSAVADAPGMGRARLIPPSPGEEPDAAGGCGPCSRLAVPLAAAGELLGSLVLVRTDARSFAPAEVAAAEKVGAMAGLALRNAALYARAQRATRMRDEVLGVVAHDLRNPLMATSMYAHVLLEAGLPREQEGWVRAVLRNTERMNALIQDLLDVSALEAGRLRVQPAPCTLGPLLGEALQLVQGQANAAGVRLSAGPVEGLPPVLADRDRVLQVLSNLLGNAVKFTPGGGAVGATAETHGSEVVIRVRDQGPGIPADDLPRVFDRFWQGAGARKGAGLGLAIARGIVESHGGRIWVESAPGQGSTFSFTLPVSALPPTAPPATVAGGVAEEPQAAVEAVTVLLVDDHSFIRRGLRELMRHSPGLRVAGEAASADEAVARAAELRPDVVLMDLNLPGGGLEATRRIVAGTPSARVLILTAEPDDACVRAALQAGASGYLRKSTDPGALLAALRAVHRGERVLDVGLQGWAAEPAASRPADPGEDAVRVLTLYACGYGAAEIAARLGMRVPAANRLRTRSMRALGLSTRADLVRYALRQGWLGPGGCPPGTVEPAAERVSGEKGRCGGPPPAPAAGRTSGRTG